MDKHLRFMTDLIAPMRVAPGSTIRLARDHDPAHTGPLKRKDADALLAEGTELLAEYQDKLAAQTTHGLLIVLQGLDASGKDGTIKHVMSGLNPQGVEVRSFKQPSAAELEHDFLWRYQALLPGRGRIGIFNRSHYEEVLVVRVHPDLLRAEGLPRQAESAISGAATGRNTSEPSTRCCRRPARSGRLGMSSPLATSGSPAWPPRRSS